MTDAQFASTRFGVDVFIDFGLPGPPVPSMVEEWRHITVDPYAVAYGLPYDTSELLGIALRTSGSVGGSASLAGRPVPDSVDPGMDIRFLAEDFVVADWPAFNSSEFYLIPGSNTTQDVSYQLYIDGQWTTFSVATISAADGGILVSETLPAEPFTWLFACTPHVGSGGSFALIQTPGFALEWRIGQLEVLDSAGNMKATTPQVGLGGAIIAAISVDEGGVGSLVAAGAGGLATVHFDGTGMIAAMTGLGSIALAPTSPVDFLEIGYCHEALTMAQLEQSVSILEGVYGVTS